MENKLIILLVIVLGAIAIAQLVRIYEISSKLRKTAEHEISSRDNNLNGRMMFIFMLLLFGFFIYLMQAYGWTGRGSAASDEGEEIDWLWLGFGVGQYSRRNPMMRVVPTRRFRSRRRRRRRCRRQVKIKQGLAI